MNKKSLLSVTIISFTILFFIGGCLYYIFKDRPIRETDTEVLLTTTSSPDGKYVLEAYKTEPGATVDFSIKVYQILDGKKHLVYNGYHESVVNLNWVNNNVVSINGKELDLSKNETYDWRR